MKKYYQIFLAALALVAGIELNIWNKLLIITLPRLYEVIAFLVVMTFIILGIVVSKEIMKDIGIISAISLSVYYILPLTGINEKLAMVNPIIVRVVSIIIVLVTAFLLGKEIYVRWKKIATSRRGAND